MSIIDLELYRNFELLVQSEPRFDLGGVTKWVIIGRDLDMVRLSAIGLQTNCSGGGVFGLPYRIGATDDPHHGWYKAVGYTVGCGD